MRPLMQDAAKAVAEATAASELLSEVAREFNTALESMRAEPPELAQFVVEAKADLDTLPKSASGVHTELRGPSERIEALEKAARQSHSRVSLELVLVGVWPGSDSQAGWHFEPSAAEEAPRGDGRGSAWK